MNNPCKIRPATIEDAVPCANICAQVWKETYLVDGGMPIEVYNEKFSDMEKVVHRWEKKILGANGKTSGVFVAEVDGHVLGYVTPHIDENSQNRLGGIYVSDRGRGIGSQLVDRAVKFFEGVPIYLRVADFNHYAIAFYKMKGFVFTGKEFFEHGLRDLEMVRNPLDTSIE